MNNFLLLLSLGIGISYLTTLIFQIRLFRLIKASHPTLYKTLGSPSTLRVTTGLEHKGFDFTMRPSLYSNQEPTLWNFCQKIRIATAVSIGLILGTLTIGIVSFI